MGVLDFSEARVTSQLDECLALFHVFQALPIMSGDLMVDVSEGESDETLVNRLAVLHENIVEMAIRAKAVSGRAADSVTATNPLLDVTG